MRILASTVILVVLLTAAAPGRGADTQPASTAELTNDSLKTILDNLGLAPKTLSKGYLIAVKRDDWTFNVQLVLSGDGTKLGLNANLGQVENPDAVTAAQWRALLISNEDIDPSFFYYDADLKKIMLHRVLDNHAITPEYLRQQIDLFIGNIKNTEKAWDFAK